MAKQPAGGNGRQRFDFTDATVEGVLASGSNSGGGTPADDEQLVRLVDDQFKMLMDGVNNGSGRVGFQVVALANPQLAAILNAIGKGGGKGGGGGPNPLGLREVHVVELEDKQFSSLMNAIGKGGGGGDPADKKKKSPWYTNNNAGKRLESFSKRFNVGRRRVSQVKGFGKKIQGAGRLLTGTKGGGALGAMGGGLAKMAGPIGIAIAAVDKIADVITDVFKAATKAVKLFGDMAIKVAKNDGIGLLTSGINAAAEQVGKIPIVGKVFAAGLELASAGLTTFKAVLDAFTARGRELAKYNPRIAMAVAMADVRKIFADMREANQNAGKYADLIMKSQELDERFQKALQPLKDAIMKLLIKLMPAIEGIATWLGDFIEKFEANMQLTRDSINPLVSWTEAEDKYRKALLEIEMKKQADRQLEKNMHNMVPDMLRDAIRSVSLEQAPPPAQDRPDKLAMPLWG